MSKLRGGMEGGGGRGWGAGGDEKRQGRGGREEVQEGETDSEVDSSVIIIVCPL